MDDFDRRKHRRLAVRLNLSCGKVGRPAQQVNAGRTVNVGSGGLYFESADAELEAGDLTEVRLSLPPPSGLLELGGTMRGHARVLRTENVGNRSGGGEGWGVQGVALEFCGRPRIWV